MRDPGHQATLIGSRHQHHITFLQRLLLATQPLDGKIVTRVTRGKGRGRVRKEEGLTTLGRGEQQHMYTRAKGIMMQPAVDCSTSLG